MALTIYRFSGKVFDYKGDAKSKEAKSLLGGKGAGLVMMAQQGLNVPPGFTITTDMCNQYRNATPAAKTKLLDKLMEEVADHMAWLEGQFGYMPLVSVRSGAPVSMPGMMDTILNVGLTAESLEAWSNRLGERAALDSARRLIQMLGSTGFGVPMKEFDHQLEEVKKEVGAKSDTDLTVEHLHVLIGRYEMAFKSVKGFEFPINDAYAQLRTAIKAVFDSWMNPRAIEYRKLNKLSEEMGTAVNVQAMVFGNMGEDSGTGVLFSRDPSTGADGMMGEFLTNAQGEDVVAGIRTPVNVNKMAELGPVWAETRQELLKLCDDLEIAYRDMVDIEFTVQQGQLFVLQSRTGKRSARAAFKIAVDLVLEHEIDVETALSRLTVDQFKTVRRPSIDPKFKTPAKWTGLPACPGVVSGKPVFSAKEAVECPVPCILVTHETNPNDIAGMAKAVGILTQTGGATSHAAVVARAMDKSCVVGCTDLVWPALQNVDLITIDGSTGRVWLDVKVPVIDSSDDAAVRQVMDWCLKKLDAVEAAPVGLDVNKPHRVMASHWWGSALAAEAVLADLTGKQGVSLDVRSPQHLAQPEDGALTLAFGVAESTVEFGKVIEKLVSANALHAMDVFHAGEAEVHKALPADYAAFKALAG